MTAIDPRASVTLANNGAGHTYTINAGAGLSLDNNTWLTANTATSAVWNNPSPTLQLNGEDADIVVNGESILGMIKNIERRLNILKINPELESEWEELRALGDQYRELEKHILDKVKTWDILSK